MRLWFGEANTSHWPFANTRAAEEDEYFPEIIKMSQKQFSCVRESNESISAWNTQFDQLEWSLAIVLPAVLIVLDLLVVFSCTVFND